MAIAYSLKARPDYKGFLYFADPNKRGDGAARERGGGNPL
jgi:hypothetical protein